MPAVHFARGCSLRSPLTRVSRPVPSSRAARGRLAPGPGSRFAALPDGLAALPAAGQSFGGRYRLDDLVSMAGPAWVWRGTDEVLNRPVTVWALHPGQPVAVQVITAVLAAAGLSDARLARIFDADCATDRPYIVSEWAPGEHLDDLLATGLPDPWTAASIMVAAGEALARAHAAGRPHLCLTPRSLLWSRHGLKITGLGIEAALSGAQASDPAGVDTRALAAVLYALLTGCWAGDGATTLPSAPRHRDVLCAPGQVRAGVPAVLGEIARRALLPGQRRPITTPAQFAQEMRTVQRSIRAGARDPQDDTRWSAEYGRGQAQERRGQAQERRGQAQERRGQAQERRGQAQERRGQAQERRGQAQE